MFTWKDSCQTVYSNPMDQSSLPTVDHMTLGGFMKGIRPKLLPCSKTSLTLHMDISMLSNGNGIVHSVERCLCCCNRLNCWEFVYCTFIHAWKWSPLMDFKAVRRKLLSSHWSVPMLMVGTLYYNCCVTTCCCFGYSVVTAANMIAVMC